MREPKQVLYSPVDISDAEYTDFQPDEKMESENAEFEAFKAEMHDAQDNAKITVGKKHTDSRGRPLGKHTFECFECGIDDYTFSQLCTRIREDFGSGLYQVLGRDSKGKFKFRKTVGVQAPVSTEVATTDNSNVGALIDKFSDAMERQAMRTEQLFSRVAGPQTGGDAFDQMTKMMAAMGGMMGAMGIQPQQPQAPKTLIEQLTEFKLLKELMGDASENGGGDANLYSLLGETVKAFGGPIAAAIAQGADNGQLNPEGVARLPAPEMENPTELQKAKDMEAHKLAMRKNIHILIQNAKTGIPPEAFALILINNTPPEKEDDLWNFISADNCVDEIIAIEPAAEAYRKWFDDLKIEVVNLMTEDELPGETSLDIPELQAEANGATIPEVDSVAGVDEQSETASNDPDNGDTPSDT